MVSMRYADPEVKIWSREFRFHSKQGLWRLPKFKRVQYWRASDIGIYCRVSHDVRLVIGRNHLACLDTIGDFVKK